MLSPTQRFSNRVENYIKYRPGYPPAILDLLRAKCGLTPSTTVADVGSGTGILTRMLLGTGCRVFGVEPNREMREAGERLLAGHANFTSVAGSAEATTLPDSSIDIITAAQAFHWFVRPQARHEFQRILRPGGWVVLLWNDRNTTGRPFFRAYEKLLLTYGTDYALVNHKNVDETLLGEFFGPARYGEASYPNDQTFDFAGLKGRLLSSSYAPEADDPRHTPMLAALQTLFDACQTNGTVTFDYDTTVYYGQLT
jgi:SAM-dependent methyltransferase